MKKVLFLFLALSLIFTSSASAGPILAGLIDGVQFCATDNNVACAGGVQIFDIDPTPGVLSLSNTTFAGVSVQGSFHTQVIGPPQNSLNSSSLSVTNTTGGTINAQLAVGGIGFVGPVQTIESSGSGTWQNAVGSTATLSWYADHANTQGGELFNDTPGILLGTLTDVAGVGVDAFSTNGAFLAPFVDPDLFSMTLGYTMNLTAGGSLISRGQNEIADVAAVPEPATMVLLGTGLLAAVRARRKKVA